MLTTLIAAALPLAEGGGEAVHADTWLLRNIWLIPFLPAMSFLLILFFGKRLPGKGAEVGVLALAAAFVLALVATFQWINLVEDPPTDEAVVELAFAPSADDGAEPAALQGDDHGDEVEVDDHGEEVEGGEHAEEERGIDAVIAKTTWWQVGGKEFSVGTMVDGPVIMMLFVVTAISLLVHIYSTDYVAGDRRYTHFFAFLSLFTSAMLFYVVSENILQMIVGWELVGVCSFVLIGHWWEEKPNSDAALKAFLTNRVGDIGLLIGVITLFFTAGAATTFSIVDINQAAITGENILGDPVSQTALTVAAISLMAAVLSKSGQFFLHTWLPDAMAGPTPVSALIHAATMVVAGVFLIARLYGVFFEGMQIAGGWLNLTALIGGVTTLVGAGLAFVQRDIKKVLAYSTISQLGYMVMALGVGAWTAAMFHLFTHAFFKACLFLGSGSVSHSVHSFDMKSDMGGLRKYMPHTYKTFMIGTAALVALPPTAGFFSKDEVLAGTGAFPGVGGNGTFWIMLIMGVATAAMTGAYMTRVVYLTFFGEFRGHGHPHESGPRITVPLWILAGFAIFAGFLNAPSNIADWIPALPAHMFEDWVEPSGVAYFPPISHASFSWGLAGISTLIALGGLGWAYYYYFVKVDALEGKATELPDGLTSRPGIFAVGYRILDNKYYLDWLYNDVIVAFTKGPLAQISYWFNQQVLDRIVDTAGRGSTIVGRFVYRYIDQAVVDGAVNASGISAGQSGSFLRRIQTGKVQQYAALLFAGATVLAGIFVAVI